MNGAAKCELIRPGKDLFKIPPRRLTQITHTVEESYPGNYIY